MHNQITVNLLQKYLIRLRQVLLVKSLYRPIIVTELYHFLAANAVIGSCICSSINSKIFCLIDGAPSQLVRCHNATTRRDERQQ